MPLPDKVIPMNELKTLMTRFLNDEKRGISVKLFAEVEAAVAQEAAFAGKIEALGTRIARERRASGDLKRTRAPKADPESGTSGFSTRNEAAE